MTAGAVAADLALTPSVSEAGTAPNFAIFMADDADSRIPLSYLPTIRNRIANLGINYVNATVPLSECEPSRATFQTGQVFQTTVEGDVAVNEYNVIPNGSKIRGRITLARPATRQHSSKADAILQKA